MRRLLLLAIALAMLVIALPAQANPGIVYVDDDHPTCGGNSPCYATIQAAINAASGGDTIIVAAGIYAERLTIGKPLELRGAQYGVDPTPAGARADSNAESIVDVTGLGYANPDIAVEITSGVSNVSIDGFTIIGDPTNTLADTCVIRCGGSAGYANNVTISNNIIDGKYGVIYKGGDALAVSRNRMVVNKGGTAVQPGAASNVAISQNVINLGSSPAGDESGIYMTSCSQCSVTGNTASGFTGRGCGGSALHHLTVSENTLTGNRDGVSIWGGSTYITISDNDLSNSLRHGINIKGQDIDITGNEIRNNGDTAINVERNVIDTERVEIHQNTITGNTNYGLKVDTANVTEVVNATCNWWGAADGPSGSGPGSGDAVSNGAYFEPWLTIPAPSECPSLGPLSSNVQASPNPVAVGGSVHLTANVDDTSTGGSNIASAEYRIGLGAQTLSWAGPGAKGFEFFLQPGSSWKGAITGIVAGPTYWLVVEDIDVTGVTGPADRYVYFNLQDAETGSTFKHLGINAHLDSPGAAGGTLLQCYQQWTWEGISSHGLNPGDLTADDFDLRFDFTKANAGDPWTVTPYFRLSGGSWTLFYDGEFTATTAFDFLGAKLVVAFDGGATGTLSFGDYHFGWHQMAAQDGTFDTVSEDVEASFTAPSAPGIYDLCVRGTDEPGNIGPEDCIMLVVYDPEGGFVTGGGWIMSPAEACPWCETSPEGKASFGFVSKYKKGANEPTGNTEFQFKTGNLGFHSTHYDWLLVTGSDYARFKGSGTINGMGDYKFMLWAGDSDPDTFRIRIWEEDEFGAETIVYDNGQAQAIGGGQIVVHQK